MTSSFSSRAAVSKILLKSTLECLFGWSYIILKLHDAARHWDLLLLWTPTAGEIICHHSKETSLRSSLIVTDRHWVVWTPTAGEIHCHFNLWRTVCCNHSKETSLRLSLIVIDRHWSSLIVIESSELLQRARLFVTLIYGVTIQKKPLWDRHWSPLIVIESSELLQRARLFITLIYGVTIQKKPLWDCHWSSLVVIDRHWVLWTPTVGEIHCHLNLWRTVWCNHSKETSVVERLYSTVKPRLTDGHLVIITVSLLCPVHFQFNPPRTLGLFHAPRLSGSLNWRKRKHENKTGENWNKNWKLLPFSRPANFSRAFLFPFLSTS